MITKVFKKYFPSFRRAPLYSFSYNPDTQLLWRRVSDIESQISTFEKNYKQLLSKIPQEVKTNNPDILQYKQQIRKWKVNILPGLKYNISNYKKDLHHSTKTQQIPEQLEKIDQAIREINNIFEQFLLKLNETIPFSKNQNLQTKQIAEKLKQGKDKLWGNLQQMYTNKKISLSTFLKKYSLGLLALILVSYLYYYNLPEQISMQRFMQMKMNSNITQVDIITYQGKYAERRVVFTVDGKSYFVQVNSKQNLDEFLRKNPTIRCEYKIKTKFMGYFDKYSEFVWIIYIFQFIILNAIILWYFSKNKGGNLQSMMSQGDKKTFDMIKETGIRFKDVIGLGESKHQISQFVDFLKNSDKYKKLGAKIPRGVLLTGPPGTGKTLLAKACAGEAGVPFFYCSGSDFVQVFVGVGAARVRDLFNAARAESPAIIFIDEIDGVGKKRSKHGRNDERDGTLNQLLVEMDGFSTNHNVVVMGATNRKELLDEALTRPGRFDRIVDINLPDLQGRFDMFQLYLKNKPLAGDVVEISKRMGTLTPGMSGADISNLCNEAAILAARADKQKIDADDLQKATERIIGGLERKNLMDEQDRKTVAVHESGHAVVAWFLQGAFPLLKVTIVPRSKGALGYAQYLPKESNLDTKQQLLDRISYILAGRCAEQYFFKSVTTGASDDLQKAFQIAYSIVTRFGMSQTIGFLGYDSQRFVRQYSKLKGNVIDQQIKKIIDGCIIVTKELISKHQDKIKKMSDRLLQKETLNANDIVEILGERPFKPHSTYQKYLQLFGKGKDQAEKLIQIQAESKSDKS